MIVNYIRLRASGLLRGDSQDFDYIFIAIDNRIITENTVLGANSNDSKHDQMKQMADSIASAMALELHSADIELEDAIEWMHLSHAADAMITAEDSPEDFLFLAKENLGTWEWKINSDYTITDEMLALADEQLAEKEEDDEELMLYYEDTKSAKKTSQPSLDDLSAAELIDLLESSDDIIKLFAWTKQDALEALQRANYFDEEDIDLLLDEMEKITGTRAYFESLMLNLAVKNL
jgi:hypothetical protein